MDRCDAYRRFAAQCVEMARRMDSPRDRSIMLDMALVWSRLAEYAAKTAAGKERTEFISPASVDGKQTRRMGKGQKSECASAKARSRSLVVTYAVTHWLWLVVHQGLH